MILKLKKLPFLMPGIYIFEYLTINLVYYSYGYGFFLEIWKEMCKVSMFLVTGKNIKWNSETFFVSVLDQGTRAKLLRSISLSICQGFSNPTFSQWRPPKAKRLSEIVSFNPRRAKPSLHLKWKVLPSAILSVQNSLRAHAAFGP